MVDSLDQALLTLKASDPHSRLAAAEYLAAHPSPAGCEALLTALEETDPHTRASLITALSRQPLEGSLPRLIAWRQQDHPGLRNAAYSVLVEIGGREAATLITALSLAEPTLRQAIAEILGDLRCAAAGPALCARMIDEAETEPVRQSAASALGKIGDQAATLALLRALQSGPATLRTAAIEALGKLDDVRAVPALLNQLTEKHADRLAVIEALGNLNQLDALPGLAATLSAEPDPAVCAALLEALIKIVIEPETARQRRTTHRLNEARQLIPVPPLLRALQEHPAPGNAYAAYLLGWLTPTPALPALIAALSHTEDPALRDAAVEAILRYRHVAMPALIEALAHPLPPVRENAAALLGMLGDAGAVPPLLQHLQDSELLVRQAVLHALGALGGEQAYAGLLQAMQDPATQDIVLGILGQTRDLGLIDNLQHYLYQGEAGTRRGAAQALSLLGDETAVSILLNAIRAPDEATRTAAADALALVRGQRALDVLIEALGDRDWLVRQQALEALSHIPDGRAVAALLPLAHDPEWRVRHALAHALNRLDDPRIYDPLTDLAQDHDHWIRREVMTVCALLRDPRAVEILVAGLRDPEPGVRRSALISLGYRRAEGEAVAACLTDRLPALRQAAAHALAQIAAPDAGERLGLLLDDPVEEVRLEAAEALGALGRETGISALELLLQDPALAVRRRAAEALARLGTPAAVEVLVAALNHPIAKAPAQAQLQTLGALALRALLRAARSSQPELRLVAAQTLGPIKNPQALPTLELLARDPDGRIREAAIAAIRLLQVE